LAAAHKTIPEHQNWMYDADPFAAQQRVEQRQAKNAQKRETNSSSQGSDSRKYTPSGEFSQLPEVRMASGLRDLVEQAVKTASDSLRCNSLYDNSPL
jgi:ATP-dependent RNA helicase DHX57